MKLLRFASCFTSTPIVRLRCLASIFLLTKSNSIDKFNDTMNLLSLRSKAPFHKKLMLWLAPSRMTDD